MLAATAVTTLTAYTHRDQLTGVDRADFLSVLGSLDRRAGKNKPALIVLLSSPIDRALGESRSPDIRAGFPLLP